MQAYATELVSIITNALSSFLSGLGAPIVGFFNDLFVVTDSVTGDSTPSVIAYVALTFVGIRIAYRFVPIVLRLLKVRA